jgi:hypothetical protein
MSLPLNNFTGGAKVIRKKFLLSLIFIFLLCQPLCLLKGMGRDLHLPFYIIDKNGEKRYGYIDQTGKIKIKPVYSDAWDFSEGLAAVKVNEKWGYIDEHGNIVIEPKFEHAEEFGEGLAAVEINGRYGFIDRSGNVVIPPQYQYVTFRKFSGGFTAVKVSFDEKENFIDKKGNFLRKDQFDEIRFFSEGLAAVKCGGKWGYINPEGKQVIPFIFNNALSFSEGMAAVKVENKAGYIDKSGKFCIQPAFDRASLFSEGLAAVMIGNEWGYINMRGDMVIEPKFDRGSVFSDGLAHVVIDHEGHCFIDKKGRLKFCASMPGYGDFQGGIVQIVFPQLGGVVYIQYYNKKGKLIWESPDY